MGHKAKFCSSALDDFEDGVAVTDIDDGQDLDDVPETTSDGNKPHGDG